MKHEEHTITIKYHATHPSKLHKLFFSCYLLCTVRDTKKGVVYEYWLWLDIKYFFSNLIVFKINCLKGLYALFQVNLPCKDENVQFTEVPFKPSTDQCCGTYFHYVLCWTLCLQTVLIFKKNININFWNRF